MAIKSTTLNNRKEERRRRKRPGVISKSRTSRLKGSKHYKKPYRGQGR